MNLYLPGGAAAAGGGTDGANMFGSRVSGKKHSSGLRPPAIGPAIGPAIAPQEIIPHLNCRACQQLQLQMQGGSQLGPQVPIIYSRLALEEAVEGCAENEEAVCFGTDPAIGSLPKELDGFRLNVNHYGLLSQRMVNMIYSYVLLYTVDEIGSGTRVFPNGKVESIGNQVQITKLSSLNAFA